ncbi:MAG: hypothetical protein ACRD2B_18595 [Terriglobia bacterium]
MRAWKILLPLVFLFLAGIVLAQDSKSPSVANNTPPEEVIVPWTHFGAEPASAPSVDAEDPPAPPAAPVSSETSDPVGTAPADPPSAPPQTVEMQNPAPAGQTIQLYEADISKKHPHPPEPVKLPAAGQATAPLAQGSSIAPSPADQSQKKVPLQPGAVSQSAAQNASRASAASTPESEILAVTSSYQKRAANRARELQQLKATARKDPSAQLHNQMRETQLLYEGAEDHMESAQELSKAYALLAGQLEDRAGKIRGLAENREQGAQAAQAELSEIQGITPTLGVALHNLSMLPAGDVDNQTISTLKAELAQDENTRNLNQERSAEAQSEMKALQADTQRLDEAAAVARQKSASCVEELQAAQAEESLLSERLQYLAARQSATDLLASASKVLDTGRVVSASRTANPSASGAATALSSPATQEDKTPRACLQKSANAGACVAQAGP